MARTAKIVTRIVYVFAALIILFALLVSTARLLTPYLNEHLPDFETWSSQLLKVPVKIDHVKIAWNIYEPEIEFDKVTFLDKNSREPKFSIQEIKVNLDVGRSLLAWKPIPEKITVRGAHLTIVQPEKGDLLIEELKGLSVADNSIHTPSSVNDILGWIFTQPNLLLKDFDVDYRVMSSTNKITTKSFTVERLNLQNSATQHQLTGFATLNQDVPLHLQTALTWTGEITDLEHIAADAYFYAEGISLPQWASEYSWKNLQIKNGLGSTKVWLRWDHNQFQQIQTQMQFYDVNVYSQLRQQSISIPRFSAHLGWKRNGKTQVFVGNDILIDLPNHLWPTTSFEVTTVPGSNGDQRVDHVRIAYFDIDDVRRLAFESGQLSEENHQLISSISPKGEITDLDLTLPENYHADLSSIALRMKFSQLGFQAWQNYPGITHANGILDWDGKKGNLTLNNQNTRITYEKLFLNPLKFDQLAAVVNWQKTSDNTWLLNIKNIELVNADMNAQGGMTFAMPPNEKGTIDLSASFNFTNIAQLPQYLPMKTFEPDLVIWLQNAFSKGQLVSGKAIVKGKLADFPFENNNGTLVVSGLLKDINLKFAPEWPSLKHADGEIIFEKSSMQTSFNQAEMLGMHLDSVNASIPYIGEKSPQILQVQGLTQSDLSKGLDVIQQSPLQATLGKDLQALNPRGPMKLKLGLIVPLKNPENTKVQGELGFKKAELNIALGNLLFDRLNGTLSFTENSAQANNLQGRLLGAPATLSITTQNEKDKPAFIRASLQSTLSVAALEKWANMPLSQYAQGATPYQANITIASHDNPQPTEIVLKTNLQGVALNLPAPYGKKADAVSDLTVSVMTTPNKPLLVNMQYAKLASAALSFQAGKQPMQLASGEIRLGGNPAVLPAEPGLVVTAQFDKLDWNMLQSYYDSAKSQMNSTSKSLENSMGSGLFRAFNLEAKIFNLFSQRLDNAKIQVTKNAKNWLLNINSSQIVGTVTVPENFSQVQGRFQRFYLTPSDEKIQQSIDPKSIPTLALNLNDVRYGVRRFGNILINTVPNANGMQIRQLRMMSSFANLEATGTWQSAGEGTTTRLQGQLTASNISRALVQWDLAASSLVGNKANMQFNLNWLDAPYNPTMGNLSGNLSLSLGAGRIVNLSGSTEAKIGIGRLLSILNLQSIPRRLSLDFSDLFQNGYSFDSIKGTFRLNNGSAFTNDLRIDGPVASIDLAGRIGLRAKDYDLKLGITTYVTGNILPAAIAVINPVAGVATWVASAAMSQITSKVSSKVASYQYSITGPWSNPNWQKLSATSMSASPPPFRR